MIGLDTNAIIDLFKDKNDIKEILAKNEEEVVLNHVLYLELMFGLNLGNFNHEKEGKFYDNLFDIYNVLNLDFKSSKKASQILQDLKNKGRMIGLFDCAIAGIYLANGVDKILTKNKKHFENIKGLKILSY